MPTCKLCREEKKLIKAHIIPHALYGPMFEDGSPVEVYPTEKGAFPKRSPQGIYDTNILCACCDNRLGVWDNVAQKFLLAPLSEFGDPQGLTEKGFFETNNVNYHGLKLFFISLLWRSHVTTHEFFAKVNLGPWADRARERLLSENPGSLEDFAVFLVKYEHPLALVMPNPSQIRISSGPNYYRFRLASYVVMIKVDKRPTERDLEPFALAPGRPVIIRLSDFTSSNEFRVIGKSISKFAW